MAWRDSQRQAVPGRGTELKIRKWWSLLALFPFTCEHIGRLCWCLSHLGGVWEDLFTFRVRKQMNPRHDLLRYPSSDYAVIWVQAVRPALLARLCCMPYSTLWQPISCPSSYSRRMIWKTRSLLRSLKVNDSVIDALRVNEVTDRGHFKDLAQDEQQLKNCAKASGIDNPQRQPSSRTNAGLLAWHQPKRLDPGVAIWDTPADTTRLHNFCAPGHLYVPYT